MSSLEEEVATIEAHSTHYSDAIVTENAEVAAYFTDQVDLAAVLSMPQRAFTDGGQFGLGCEMGISTQNCMRVVQWAWKNDQLQVCGYWWRTDKGVKMKIGFIGLGI